MKRIITSIIPLLLALSFVNAKANDVLRQNEDDTMRCGIYAGNPMMYVDPTGMQFENYEIVDYICNYIRNIFTENFDLIEVCKNDFVNNNSSDVAESDYNFMSNLIEENNCLFDALLYIDMLSKNKTCYGFGTNNNSEKLNYVLLDNDNVNRVIGSDVGTWIHELSHLAQKEIEKKIIC